ncbi:hypothetical protein BS50DRAFT_64437 [Corynespora cassiicola Philippines]|uniref:Uncharacterized protein n=1 Tax=Corynespora cassiicola Philippines TaxID=1448308 RepID=A0A2T2NJQ7_CORCC|nr:hypothetical protein BS50DRAFT_64437 [Corynespora cassiicola Philippines]
MPTGSLASPCCHIHETCRTRRHHRCLHEPASPSVLCGSSPGRSEMVTVVSRAPGKLLEQHFAARRALQFLRSTLLDNGLTWGMQLSFCHHSAAFRWVLRATPPKPTREPLRTPCPPGARTDLRPWKRFPSETGLVMR